MSSDNRYIDLKNFKEIEAAVIEITSDPNVCGQYHCDSVFRIAKAINFKTKGCSKLSGEGEFYVQTFTQFKLQILKIPNK